MLHAPIFASSISEIASLVELAPVPAIGILPLDTLTSNL